jgi:iron(III) transport system substrate-binding protein
MRRLLASGLRALIVAAIAATLGAGLARAQNSKAAELAALSGPERTQKLVEGAQKEGALTLYTSATLDDMNAVARAFERKYGVKVRVWRAGNDDILQRAQIENRAGRYDSDLFETDAIVLEGLKRENLLQPVTSPVFADLMPQAVKPGAWIGTRLSIITGAYNTNMVSAEDAPRNYDDLLDPKWKGKLGIEAGAADWFSTVVKSLGEDEGLKLFRAIIARNGASVRKGNVLMANLVATGEVPVTLTTYLYRVNQLKRAGAPIEAFQLPPTVARVNGVGLSAHAPHPHAALLFFDFLLTDAQMIFSAREIFPTNETVRRLTDELKPSFVDPATMMDEGDKWEKLFNEIVIRQQK